METVLDRFLVTLGDEYARDLQTLPSDHFIDEDSQYEDVENWWQDFGDGKAEIVLGIITARHEGHALIQAKRKWGYNEAKLNTYKLAKY